LKAKILKIREKQLRTPVVVTFLAYWNEVQPENEHRNARKILKKELNELLENFSGPGQRNKIKDSYKKSALMGI